MADSLTKELRSALMARVRSRGNESTEIRLIKVMKAADLKGWRRGRRLVGRPDFVFPAARLAIFVDGDFWHGNPKTFRQPKDNFDFWKQKIQRNRSRDRKVNRLLRSMGWSVIRIWESSLAKRPSEVVNKIAKAVRSAALRSSFAASAPESLE
jgi:DNA mismatch endonuclease (patch repair protein)